MTAAAGPFPPAVYPASWSLDYATKGEWVGIALDEPEGKNAGTIKGVSYFACDDKHGIMVRRTECKVV